MSALWKWLVDNPNEVIALTLVATVVTIAVAVIAILVKDIPLSRRGDAKESIDNVLGQLGANTEIEREHLQGSVLRPADSDPIMQVWSLGGPVDYPALLIVAPDTKRPSPRQPKSADFSFLTAFGDLDALVEVLVFFARLFPRAILARFTSSKITPEHRQMPIVSIGGPLGDGGIGGNQMTAYANSALPMGLSYSFEPPVMKLGGITIPSLYDAEKTALSQDAAVIIRMTNPWRPEFKMLVFQGTHTLGVVGAVRALTDSVVATINTATILEVAGNDPEFVAAFPVKIDDGYVLPPIIPAECIHRLK